MFTYIEDTSFDKKFKAFNNLRFVETRHCNNMACYGLVFTTTNGVVYYSGDTNDLEIVDILFKSGHLIDKMYLDTTSDDFKGNPHLYIGKIEKAIPNAFKKHVYCMHLNNDECIKIAKEIGFNVVENIEVKNKVLVKK